MVVINRFKGTKMNLALIKMQNYDPHNGPVWNAEEAIDAGIIEIEKLLKIKQHRDVLAMHLAEIKAIDDGKSDNTITDTIEHCLAEIAELGL